MNGVTYLMSSAIEEIEKHSQNNNVDRQSIIVPSSKWVRVYFGGKLIADSRHVILLRLSDHALIYYFPKDDVRMEYLEKSSFTTQSPIMGSASYWNVRVGDQLAENAAWDLVEPFSDGHNLEGFFAFDWAKMEAWFEEDEEVFVHPRDPFHRIDVIHSSRHIRVVVGGETVAETQRPVLLFETGLPTRYYLPKLDVRMELLVPSDTHTGCPYKGTASYYSLKVGNQFYPDIAWYYPFPYPDMGKIQNLISFYDEWVEAVYVDGEKLEKPRTQWSQDHSKN
jgi:uncharacterized protein (DUF427 family)